MKITIIGCGNMGKGLAHRLSAAHQLYLYDKSADKTERLEQEGYGKSCSEISEALHAADIVILAVKPQNLQEAANLIKLKKEQILISLLAGISIKTLKEAFPDTTLVRMMPNLPLIYGKGVIGLCSDEKDNTHLTKAFEPLGKVHWLPENKINALTALTGSGPAFFFAMIEAMTDAGIAMGFTPKEAQDLVHQMLQGSMTLLEKKHPGELIKQIASPQGTTVSGLKKLEELDLRGVIMDTFLAAYDRANQLEVRS